MAGTFDLMLVMEHVECYSIDPPALPPPRGLVSRQRRKIRKYLFCMWVFLHSQSRHIVYGDIKDTNAAVEKKLTGALNVKVFDFGLGRMLTRIEKPLGGTLVW